MFFSYIGQTLPPLQRIRVANLRLIFILFGLVFGVVLAAIAGPVVERALFWVEYPKILVEQPDGTMAAKVEYNIRAWLSAHRQDVPVAGMLPDYYSSPIGGWMIIFLPFTALGTMILMVTRINPLLSRMSQQWGWNALAWADMTKFILGCIIAVIAALIISAVVGHFIDARGGIVDQYIQRNALVVGVMMGFAVIPIIYTIADDAMSAVPESLRSASLGAGATPWQTAVRVIVPTAMSGLFSACMIGFGRAVGETMIVLMAAGNTPIMEWNIFNGFRTLSANIAVEMMEAVKDSTNYRILFLAALTLFAMTFVINTIAEAIRLHYRKKAFEL